MDKIDGAGGLGAVGRHAAVDQLPGVRQRAGGEQGTEKLDAVAGPVGRPKASSTPKYACSVPSGRVHTGEEG